MTFLREFFRKTRSINDPGFARVTPQINDPGFFVGGESGLGVLPGSAPMHRIHIEGPGYSIAIRDSDGCLLISERMPHKFGLLKFPR